MDFGNTTFDNLKTPEYRYMIYDDITKALLRGGVSLEMAQSMQFILHNYYKDDFSKEFIESEVLRIHLELLQSGGYKIDKRNIQQEIEDLIDFRGKGEITLAQVYEDLKLTGKEDRSAARMALNRIVARGIISKVDSGRTGIYHKPDYGASETKFLTAPLGEFQIKLPLNLNEMCKIYPKNIIIISGSKSAGKTTFLLNIALANQNKMPVVYLNSEMGDEEFTDRMLKMGCNSPEDIKFKIFNKSTDYHDMVNGNRALYIVDFLEIHDKFYEIGKPIRAIHEKLQEGVAVIAIQMRQGTTIGRGGDFSKEKSRLYLALDYLQDQQCSRVTIEEMKSPKNEAGYRGWSRRIKIINGSRISPVDNWNNIGVESETKKPFVQRYV